MRRTSGPPTSGTAALIYRWSQVEDPHGIRVTSLVRTLIDITRFHGINKGVVAMTYQAPVPYDRGRRAHRVNMPKNEGRHVLRFTATDLKQDVRQ